MGKRKPPKNAFQKGHPKLGGRKKGTPNKFTTIKHAIEEAFKNLGGSEFVEEVAATCGARGKVAVLQAAVQLVPKRTEMSGPDGGPINMKTEKPLSEMSDAELIELKAKLNSAGGNKP